MAGRGSVVAERPELQSLGTARVATCFDASNWGTQTRSLIQDNAIQENGVATIKLICLLEQFTVVIDAASLIDKS